MGKLYIANCLYAAFGLAFAGLLFCAQTPFGVAVCVTVITLCGAEIVVGLVEARKPIITRPERARGPNAHAAFRSTSSPPLTSQKTRPPHDAS